MIGRALSHHLRLIARASGSLGRPIALGRLRPDRNVSAVVAILLLVWIEEEIEGQEQSFRMPCKQQTEKKHRHKHCRKQLPYGQIEFPFQKPVDDQAQRAANSIVDRPDGHQIIAGLALIRISTSRTSIQRGEPITQRAHFFPANKYWANPAGRTSQPQRAVEVTPSRGRWTRLFHRPRIRRQLPAAKAGLFILSEVSASANTGEFSRYAKYDPGGGSMGR